MITRLFSLVAPIVIRVLGCLSAHATQLLSLGSVALAFGRFLAMWRKACWLLAATASLAFAQDPASLPVEVAAASAPMRLIGRFDLGDSKGPRCAWSASTIKTGFNGRSLNVRLQTDTEDYWDVLIDGKPAGVLEITKDRSLYPVAAGLPPGDHQVELVKRTEFRVGSTQLLSFQIEEDGKLLLPPAAPDRRIEVIGDSISCGYGNEAPTKEEAFTPRRENANIAYGALAARVLGADYMCIAWSGKKLWPNNSILDYYDRTLPQDKTATWNFSAWKPQVVVINLGTNDFGVSDPDGPGWTEAYRALLKRLRAQYPEAWIYATLGTMLGDWPAPRKPASTIRSYLTGLVREFHDSGDTRVNFIDFGTQRPENGFGGSWHPSARTHQLMADQLVKVIRRDLKW